MLRPLLLSLLTLLLTRSFAQQPDPWILKADTVDPSNYYGVTAANGMIGLVSSPQPLKVSEVVLAGAYDLYGRGRVSNFLRSFNLLNMYLEIDGKRLEPRDARNLTQALDMRTGSFTGSFDYGDRARIRYTYMALRHLPFTVLMNVEVEALQEIRLTAANYMEAPDALKDVQNYYNEIDRPHVVLSLLTSTAKSPTGRLQLCASNTFLFEERHGQEPRVIHEMWDNNMHLIKFSKTISAKTTYRFSVVGSSITSAHHDDPLNEAERLTIYARLEGRDCLTQFHNAAWQALWNSDIRIEGDPLTQQEVHGMMYHLYAFVRQGTSFSPSPMGLSGLGYNGHVFWDTELWMFPALLVLQPELGKSMIEYRFQRLDAARRNAFSKGFRGAMFPWESAETGVEETPVWALSGPFEHHITACVGIAAWNYYCVTQDKNWLREKGWPLLKETADFWASRVERKGPGRFEINNVVAADEWAENVDNNAFTNAAARANLEYAIETGRLLGIAPDPDWELVRKNIPILRFPDGVTREHATYNGEKIKQADVNLLAYPLREVSRPEDVRKDLEYYEPRVGEGPAMTHAIFSILWNRLGNAGKAINAFHSGYRPNRRPPFGVLAETATGSNPYFATGAGGMLQSILMGFGGLEITPRGITQRKSVLPSAWKKLTLTGIGLEKKTYIANP